MAYRNQTSSSTNSEMALWEVTDPEVSDRDTNLDAHPDSSPPQIQPAGFGNAAGDTAQREIIDLTESQVVSRDTIHANIDPKLTGEHRPKKPTSAQPPRIHPTDWMSMSTNRTTNPTWISSDKSRPGCSRDMDTHQPTPNSGS
jgi:hypothetical protein